MQSPVSNKSGSTIHCEQERNLMTCHARSEDFEDLRISRTIGHSTEFPQDDDTFGAFHLTFEGMTHVVRLIFKNQEDLKILQTNLRF